MVYRSSTAGSRGPPSAWIPIKFSNEIRGCENRVTSVAGPGPRPARLHPAVTWYPKSSDPQFFTRHKPPSTPRTVSCVMAVLYLFPHVRRLDSRSCSYTVSPRPLRQSSVIPSAKTELTGYFSGRNVDQVGTSHFVFRRMPSGAKIFQISDGGARVGAIVSHRVFGY